MTAPKIGERYRECANEIIDTADEDASTEAVANCIAKHFPEDGYVRIPAERYKQMTDDSWVERAAEEIVKTIMRIPEDDERFYETVGETLNIINGCRR